MPSENKRNNLEEINKRIIEEKIDVIIQGAGFRSDTFEIAKKGNVPVFAMASSASVAKKAEDAGAAGIVIEGCKAGGHLYAVSGLS